MKNERVLVLNNACEVHDVTNSKSALKLLLKGKAEALKHYDDNILSINQTYRIPSVIRLFEHFKFYRQPIRYCAANVFLRDKFTCQYCFKKMHNKSPDMTLDHVIPQSLGGPSTWSNSVTACKRCNSYKGNKTLSQLGWVLQKEPGRLTFYQFHHKFANPHPEWLEYFYI